ncbi:hypothetical protein [Rubrolithibacter danxiaensis]|uniref:hypothetical protein n=1 Tax=Rubrolithibacter danxiaensis TaxID=3390805 RepID=UPI003BF7D849
MKPLSNLTNIEKAKLLHQLFPDEIPALLEFVQNMCVTIKEQEQLHREQWENGLFSFDFWLSQLYEAEQKINHYGIRLSKSVQLFADQLFEGYLAVYLVHCLMVYTTTRQHPNIRFAKAVDLLFNP